MSAREGIRKGCLVLIKAFFFSSIAAAIFLFSPRKISAAGLTITSFPSSVNKLEEFDVSFSGQQLEPDVEYYLKVRIGKEGKLDKGETYNHATGNWFHDSSSWTDFPKAITDPSGSLATVVGARARETAEAGINKLMVSIRKVTSTSNIGSESVDIEIGESPTPTLTPTQTETPTPSPLSSSTPTLTPTSSPSKATYQINEVKNEDGDILANVKVYLDGVYLHHYAPESLTFCDGCQCDTYVDCSFGEHAIKLEKSDYQDWSERAIIESGDSYTIDPVMQRASSDSDSSPTSTPTPTLAPTSTPGLSATPSPKPTKPTETIPDGEILGESESLGRTFYPWQSDQEGEEVQEGESSGEPKRKTLPFIFLGLGFTFLFAAGFYLWYTQLR